MYVGIYTWGWRNKKPLLKTAHLTTYDIISMTAMLKFALQLADFLNAQNSLVPILLVLCSGKPDCWNLGILFGILNLATWFKELTHWEKTLMLAKTEGRKKRGWQEYEMVGQHHQFNGHEFEQTLGDSGRQRNLACCSPWSHKELNTLVTEQQQNKKIKAKINTMGLKSFCTAKETIRWKDNPQNDRKYLQIKQLTRN